MNVTELARKLKLNTQELLEILPEFGFDIGKKAIKVDDKIARKIVDLGSKIREKVDADKQAKLDEFKKLSQQTESATGPEKVEIPEVITVRDFAKIIEKPVNEVIKELMKNGVMASLNERVDFETAAIIGDEFGIKVSLSDHKQTETQDIGQSIKEIIGKEAKDRLKKRAPVVVVMGHVDHGKTKLLDTIRTTNVIEGEAGGITQHIGAYQVEKKGKQITFIDTPGHEAFTAMRSRGAKVADIAILVIAANDSIKPQTKEAIKIIQQSDVPMIVAINKIDLEDANIEKVKQDLASLNLTPEDWGGKTLTVPISAKENIGIDDLLETVLLVDEMQQESIVANPDAKAVGTVIESHINKGEGPVATILIQNGTLKLGDNLCVNHDFFGKARALKDFNNQEIETAGPSVPVKIIGLKYAPKVGDIVQVMEKVERKHKKTRAFEISKDESIVPTVSQTEEEQEEAGIKTVNIILKADVLGSLEVIYESLEKLESQEVKTKIISKGLGNITDSDINLAESSKALVIAFNVKAIPLAEDLAREKQIEIKYYDVIYNLLEDIKEKMSALLSPDVIRTDLGTVEVLAIFKTENKKMVIGGKVLSGKIMPQTKVDVIRKKEKIVSGEIEQLQVGKEVVTEVLDGQECGISFLGKAEIQEGDILEVYKIEEKAKKL